jgi:hypothetical protein
MILIRMLRRRDMTIPNVVVHLTDAVVKGKSLYAELLHSLKLLLVEVLQLVQRQDPVPVQVHAPGNSPP